MSFSSDELNLLIYQYQLESNFKHSAHVFAAESNIVESNINLSKIAPAGLINIVQKGLLYTQADINEVLLANKLTLLDAAKHTVAESSKSTRAETENQTTFSANDKNQISVIHKEVALVLPIEMPHPGITSLIGPKSNVCVVWNPVSDILASSINSVSRIWNLTVSSNPSNYKEISSCSSADVKDDQIPKDTAITCVDWNCNGDYLATGSYNGYAQIWTADGRLVYTLGHHKGPILDIKWNKIGTNILTAGADNCVKTWDVNSAKTFLESFGFSSKSVTRVAWKTNTIFAIGSPNQCILVCELYKKNILKTFKGHSKEINCIEWDPRGRLLASGSDDTTIKIWSINKNTYTSLHGHSKEVHTVKWSFTSSSNLNEKLLLVSASFDNTMRIWDLESRSCVKILTKHNKLHSVAFSPNGTFLASGGDDKHVNVWTLSGALCLNVELNQQILKVAWNSRGNRIAAGFSNGLVAIVSFNQP